ncbi:major facilitator superfamily domain-containing protein [Gymnopilus junonius]|uniref:Major facilitator superfamily domain-containing protein n=1 Tax=Gymnopilus junonius TaxID=109634 RepID=A0A9P5NV96_GYMJU|nr:major facilitator superfamily domain-containing protein [Gymnopilus junonius]
MSRSLPRLDTVSGDALIASDFATFSPSTSRPRTQAAASSSKLLLGANSKNENAPTPSEIEEEELNSADESAPLLPGRHTKHGKKPFYRARPLWLVPFAITASLVRGMTLAPRVEVYTQLSCNRLHGQHHWNHTTMPPTALNQLANSDLSPQLLHASLYSSLDPLGTSQEDQDGKDSDDTEDPRQIPSTRCQADAAVQAAAARLQTMMTTIMGLLSALTTGWWGHFGERHGRTRVLAVATLGLFLTDLAFILVSTPGSVLAQHGHNLLLIAPVIEGLLGGWSTLQSATSAYLSDCTSPGSRAHIFSRFQGVFYLGFAVGPTIGGWFIQHPIKAISGTTTEKSVTSVFWVAVICSFVNLVLTLFVFPESLGKKKREAMLVAEAAVVGKGKAKALVIEAEDPLSVFLPVVVLDPSPYGIGHRKRRDWSLTMLAIALFGFMLSTGVFQIKYLYAVHMYGWDAEHLSYYISFMGGARAMWLLFLLPTLIGFFKPKPKPVNGNGKQPAAQQPAVPSKKPKPTRAQLGQEIKFDLILTKCSLCIDVLSHTLVSILPAPGQALFVLASSLNGLGSGAVPAIHSLALCMMQVRALDANGASDTAKDEEGTGALFGALAVLQAVGQMILGPMLFGLIYSGTVAELPKAIFATAAGILVCALAMVMCVRNPVRVAPAVRTAGANGKRRRRDDGERGRSRLSKDLRGGAIPYYGSASEGMA